MRMWVQISSTFVKRWTRLHTPATPVFGGGRERWIPGHQVACLAETVSFKFGDSAWSLVETLDVLLSSLHVFPCTYILMYTQQTYTHTHTYTHAHTHARIHTHSHRHKSGEEQLRKTLNVDLWPPHIYLDMYTCTHVCIHTQSWGRGCVVSWMTKCVF